MLGLYRLHWDITLCLVYTGYIGTLHYAWFIQVTLGQLLHAWFIQVTLGHFFMLGLYRLHWDITLCLVYTGYIGTLLYAWFIQVTLGHYFMLGLYRLHWDITLFLVYPGFQFIQSSVETCFTV